MNAQLSSETRRRIDALFPQPERDAVVRLLQSECGNNLPLLESFDDVQLERVRFAALKLSGGNLRKLRDAVRLAKEDWRDLLVSAQFADDVNAHSDWFPDKHDS
jgi:hypothetical protein